MKDTDKKSYVVYYCERLRDGNDDGAKIVTGLDNALAMVERLGNGFTACNMEIRLFELGREIPLEMTTSNEEVVTKTKNHFKVKR